MSVTYELTCRMKAPAPLGEVFPIFENPYNLAKITPSWLNFRILTPNLRMRAGLEIDYIIKWLGLPMKWRTLITRYDPPGIFVDEQAKGPYALWRHFHTFEETPDGVIISDRVQYRMPLGILGRIANAVLVRHQLLGIFRYRQKAIAEMLNRPGITFNDPEIRVVG